MIGFLRSIVAKLRPVVEQYDDSAFGPLRRERGGSWYGEVRFRHPPTRTASLSFFIDSGEGQPTDGQRFLFREILARYAGLWPRVAEALADYHPALKTVEAVAAHIEEPCLSLGPIIDGQPRRWSIQYTFDYPAEGDMGYFVVFCEWDIVGVEGVD